MKKNFFLTLVLAVLCTATSWAQFAPVEGKAYVLKFQNYDLYVDIQTKGHADNNDANCISASFSPKKVYFEVGTDGKWKIKNVNSEYIGIGNNSWNAAIGKETQWTILAEESVITISGGNGYIGVDTPRDGGILYSNTSKNYRFEVLEYDKLTHSTVYTTFKAVKIDGKDTHDYDTYLNTTTSSNTAVSFQKEATKFRLIRMGDAYYIRLNDSGQPEYLAVSNNTYDVIITSEPYLWKVSDEDGDGDFIISKNSNNSHRLGSDGSTSERTGVYANVGTNCNEWIKIDYLNEESKPTFTDETDAIESNGQYLTALELDGTTVLSGLTEPSSTEDMYVMAPLSGVSLEPGCEYTFSLTFPKNQTNQILVANLWFDKDGDGEFETHLGTTGDKAENVGDTNDISTVTFTVPADASLLLTRIRLRLDSSWKIAENANDEANRMVYDIPVTIALPYFLKIENPSGEKVSVTYNGNPIQDGSKIGTNVAANLFDATNLNGYVWRVVIDSKTKTVTLVYEKLYSLSLVDAPDGTAVKYNGTDVTTGSFLGLIVESEQLSVECPQGYTWEISADNENKVISITFKQLVRVENPAAVVALIKRVGGRSAAVKFKFVLEPSLNYDKEVFVIGSEDGKVLIKGTTISAITTGIGWYLNNYAHINIAWNSLNEKTVSGDKYADLSNIPVPTGEEVRTSDAMYRYYLNTCTFGYSMTSWTWKRWQQEIDWMALHGINMPLQLVGMEEVWRKFLTMEEGGKRKYGYTDAEAKAFVAGPAFIAWWAMNNLEGWGGTVAGTKSGGTWEGAGGVQDDAWYKRQKALAKQITDRQRELGMQPVLPGWSGMVPTNFASKSGYATRANGGNWAGDFVRPLLLNVSNANYAEIAADYYKCLHEVMGESQYYSMDPFHEGGGAGTMEDYEALYAAMEAAKPASQWVIQQWQWSPTQKLSLTAVPAGRLVVLDLFSDGSPAFDAYSGYTPQDAVFCAIPNFGGRSGLMGRLNNLADNYFKFKGKYPSIKGVGAAPEAIEQTPVTYDLIFQLPWMGTKPDVAEWVANYSIARYGVENAELQAAWELLRQGVLNYGADGIQGPVEDVWAARPNLTANKASFWGKTLNDAMGTYNKERQLMLIDATYKLLAQDAAITGEVYRSNYLYDIVEFGGGVMADYAYYLLLGVAEAKSAAGANFATDVTYIARRNAFLQLILDVDNFKGTNLNFRLGKWTQEARAAAQEAIDLGATAANADWYEYNNARTIVSTWSSPNTNLNDYSYRSWQGLMKDLYYPRWKHYFDKNCAGAQYGYFEWNWAHGMTHAVGQSAISTTPLAKGQQGHTDSYTREPEGNTVDEAKAMLGKYIIPVRVADGTYYAYRYLENDIRKTLTLSVNEGSTLNISEYFGELNDVTITAGCIEGEANDAANVVIKSGSANGTTAKYDVNIALNDGTVIKFALVVNTAEFAVEKEALAKLIEDMKELTSQVGTFNPVGSKTKVTLQATDANTANYIWTNAQSAQEGPIADLIDGETGTFFHTDYSAGDQTPGSHYIAIDLGAGNTLGRFTFDYTTRNGGTRDFPDKIVVYASNDRDANYEEIAVITEPVFPQSTNTKWELGDALYTNKRYLRFNVYAERGYWHMSEFNIYNNTRATADVFDAYSGAELTDEFVAEKYNVLLDAIIAYNNATTKDEITAKKDALQTAYNQLKEKMDAALPFTLTTDENAPVLYKIQVNRDFNAPSTTVLKYNENTGLVNIEAYADNSSWQAWYFMLGENGILIKPFNGDGKVLAADNNEEGHSKVWAVKNGTKTICEWTIEKNGDWYNILGNGKCFSNHSGNEHKTMGFYNNKGDGGSQFKFIEAEFTDDNARYYQLSDVLATMPVGTNMMSGDAPGCYPGGDDYYTAYTTVSGLKDAGSDASASDDCYAAYKELRAAKSGLGNMIMPEDGKIYRIKNLIVKANEGERIHYLSAGATKFPKVTDQTTRWRCIKDGETYKFVYEKNVSVVLAWENIVSDDDAQAFTIKPGVERGAVCLANGTTNLALTNESYVNGGLNFNNAINDGKIQETTLSTDWYLEPVGEYPFVITTDEDAPVLYNIFIKRDLNNESGVALLEYNESDSTIAVRKTVANNSWQAWYFMKSDNGFTVHPYNACGKVIGANDTGDAAGTVKVANKDDHTYDEWKVVERTDNEWNIQVYDGSNYFSNKGGVGYKMGFWGTDPDSDGGSLFKFVEAEFENDNARYYQLSDVLATMPVGTNIAGGQNPGYYPGGDEYKAAYNDAMSLKGEGNGADSDACYDAYLELLATKASLGEMIMPMVGKVYRIKNYTVNTPAEYQYHYLANSNASIVFPTSVEDGDNSAMWVCTGVNDGKYKFVSALGTASFGWRGVTEEAVEYTISAGVVPGALALIDGTTSLALTTEAWNNSGKAAFNQAINSAKAQAEYWSTDWYLEEVENPGVSYAASINKGNMWATMYLPYAVTIPQGVEVYYAVEDAINENVITLTQFIGTIPARTAVLLRREGNAPSTKATENFEFALAEDVEAVENLFDGTIMRTAIPAPDGTRVYLLTNYNATEKFYWMDDEYDENCVLAGHGSGHVKNDANRAYLKIKNASPVSSYSFRFEGTTGVEEIEGENGEVKAIYDLQGRKLSEITEPGFYIVNGKKVWVK